MSGDPRSTSPPTVAPAVFLASLTDYVNGIVHGQWAGVRSVEQMQAAVAAVLASSPWTAATGEPAEEWVILDHEGFTGSGPDAHEALADVVAMAEMRASIWPAINIASSQCRGYGDDASR